jgi:DNA primase
MSQEVELIKERLDIADIVGEYVKLKRAGRSFKGLCPFHQERTPSFIVSPDRGTWHCFGACSEGGDVFSFIEKVEGIDFPAALKLLADRAGVELTRRGRGSADGRERLFALLELASRFYAEILLNQAAGTKARDYLVSRGVQPETLKHFGLGYAPNRWDVLQTYLRAKGYSPREMLAAGLVGESRRSTLYDRFRGRIMFPVTDLQGRVVAFGGRIAPWHETGEEGKYINSPETELYSKRRVVYNLARAKQHLKSAACLVVEGYMDVVLLDQAGVHNVVASSGTAFTAEHIAQLKRFTDRLHFAFDADAAGVKAAIAATHGALSAGMRVATVVLPEGQDPADVALRDPDELRRRLGEPRSLVEVLLDRLRARGDARAQEEYLEALLPLMAATANPVQLGEMVQEVARLLSIPESRVVHLLEDSTAAGRAQYAKDAGSIPAATAAGSAERAMLGLLISSTEARETLLGQLAEDFFVEPDALVLYRELVRVAGDGASLSLAADEVIGRLAENLVSYAEGLRQLAEEQLAQSQAPTAREGAALLAVLQRRRLQRQLAHLQEKLLHDNDKQRKQTLRQFHSLTQELARIHAQQQQ